MNVDPTLKKLQEYLTLEQRFHHQMFLNSLRKLENEQLIEIGDIIHTNYLVRDRMFNKLVSHCIRNGYKLPAFSTLLTKESNQ